MIVCLQYNLLGLYKFLFLPELTSEESLAMKANYAREMAKAVNSAQFKKKRLIAKKQEPRLEEKEKVSLLFLLLVIK